MGIAISTRVMHAGQPVFTTAANEPLVIEQGGFE